MVTRTPALMRASARRLALLTGLTGLAFALRAVNIAHQPFLGWDDAIFAVGGKQLLQTGQLPYTWGRPTHVILLALVFRFLGIRAGVGALAPVFLGLLTVPLISQLGRKVFGWQAGVAAAALLAGSYFHVWWSRWLQSQAGVILCLALALLVYVHTLTPRGGRAGLWIAAGLLLGTAYTLHYSVVMLLPIWGAFEIYAGFRFPWPLRLRLQRIAGLAIGVASIVGLFAFVLMPPEHPLWYKAAGWYNWRALARGCCYLNEVITPFFEDGLGYGALGDWSYYFRTVLAIEGPLGFIAFVGAWAYGSRTVLLKGSVAQKLILWQAVGAFALLAVTSMLGADARAKIAALVLVPNVLLAGHALSALARWAARRQAGWLAPLMRSPLARVGLVALGAGLLSAHVWPLLTVVTPYEAIAQYLWQRPGRPVVGLYSGSHVKPFVWRFYLGDAYLAAENGEELRARCLEAKPAWLLKSSDTAMPPGLQQLPLVRAYPDLTTILVTAHYEETHNRTYVGKPYLPGPPGSIQVYELRNCAAMYN